MDTVTQDIVDYFKRAYLEMPNTDKFENYWDDTAFQELRERWEIATEKILAPISICPDGTVQVGGEWYNILPD